MMSSRLAGVIPVGFQLRASDGTFDDLRVGVGPDPPTEERQRQIWDECGGDLLSVSEEKAMVGSIDLPGHGWGLAPRRGRNLVVEAGAQEVSDG
jgi:hypothetical protein